MTALSIPSRFRNLYYFRDIPRITFDFGHIQTFNHKASSYMGKSRTLTRRKIKIFELPYNDEALGLKGVLDLNFIHIYSCQVYKIYFCSDSSHALHNVIS